VFVVVGDSVGTADWLVTKLLALALTRVFFAVTSAVHGFGNSFTVELALVLIGESVYSADREEVTVTSTVQNVLVTVVRLPVSVFLFVYVPVLLDASSLVEKLLIVAGQITLVFIALAVSATDSLYGTVTVSALRVVCTKSSAVLGGLVASEQTAVDVVLSVDSADGFEVEVTSTRLGTHSCGYG
jgi:hypothetical protein